MQRAILLYQFRPSVRPMPLLLLNEYTYRHNFDILVGHLSSFFEPTAITNSDGSPSAGAINTRVVRGKSAFLDRNRHLSRKQYEIGLWLLWITNSKSQLNKVSVTCVIRPIVYISD